MQGRSTGDTRRNSFGPGRRFWILCAAALLASAVSSAQAARRADDELVVWLVHNNSGYRAICREFERRSGMRLLIALNPRGMDPQKILCGIAGGDPPDVLYQDRFAVGGFAARGAFIPLDDLIASSDLPWEAFYEGTREEATYQGSVYAIPEGCDNRALYYNKALLRRAGLVDGDGEPAPPRDWPELQRYAGILTEAEGERFNRIGFDPNYGNVWLYMYSWQNGGEFMSEDRTQCTLNTPENIEALQYMVDVYDEVGGREAVMKFSSTFEGGENDPFFAGKVAMKTDGNWVLNLISQYAPNLDFGVAPAPMPHADDDPISWAGGFAWTIPVGAQKPDRGWEFITFAMSEEGQRLYHDALARESQARGQPYVPNFCARRDINEEILYPTYVKDNADLSSNVRDGYRVFMGLLLASRYRPVTPVGQLLWDEHVRAYEQATLHRMSAQRALDLGTERVQKELDLVLAMDEPRPVNWAIPIGIFLLIVVGMTVAGRVHLRRSGARYGRREKLAGLMFASPWFIGFIVFTAGPILISIVLSFCDYDVLHAPQYVGLDNYKTLLSFERVEQLDEATGIATSILQPTEPTFWKSLFNTVFMVLGVPLGMAVGLAIAMLLNAKVGGLSFYRTIYYLPAVVPIVAGSILWIWVLNPENGLLNNILRLVTPETWTQPGWLTTDSLWTGSKMALIIMGLWGAGAGMIIWLAGLKGIPQHLYEAAMIDGAGPWARFRHVTVPQLSPYIFFNLVMGIIGTFQIFDQAYVMTEGGPADSTLFYVYFLFKNAFQYFRMGTASAQAWILFVIILILTMVQLKLAPRWVHYESE